MAAKNSKMKLQTSNSKGKPEEKPINQLQARLFLKALDAAHSRATDKEYGKALDLGKYVSTQFEAGKLKLVNAKELNVVIARMLKNDVSADFDKNKLSTHYGTDLRPLFDAPSLRTVFYDWNTAKKKSEAAMSKYLNEVQQKRDKIERMIRISRCPAVEIEAAIEELEKMKFGGE